MKYLTNEQQVVVEARIKMGYSSNEQSNGNILLYKGKHTMIINCLGYDVYLPKGSL
jgi:hypothetical protein